MKHVGIFCPNDSSHLRTQLLLGQALTRRGHAVTLFNVDEAEPRVRQAGLDFRSIGRLRIPVEERYGRVLSGRAWIRTLLERMDLICQAGLARVRETGVDLLLVDQMELAGAVVADLAGLPFVSVCSALPWNAGDADVPPSVADWTYSGTALGRFRNRCAYGIVELIFKRYVSRLNRYRRCAGLLSYRCLDDSYSKWAQLTSLVPEFDFPRKAAPRVMHFTGPYSLSPKPGRQPGAFPFERLDGRSLAYASLGTMLSVRKDTYRLIAEACAAAGCQLAIGLGGCGTAGELAGLPGDPIVVDYAPQLELLARSSLLITHGGLNSVLEALGAGVPVVAIPFSGDGPGVAARIRWHGVGVTIPARRLRGANLRAGVRQVLEHPSFKEKAARMRAAIRGAGGVSRAADVVEAVLATGKPVLAQERTRRLLEALT